MTAKIVNVSAARGESNADIVRRLGLIGSIPVSSTATDQEVIDAYRDDLVSIVEAAGYTIIASVATATAPGDGNITLSGEQTIAGVTTSASRVLLTDQTDASENGIWVSASGSWARASDFDETSEVVQGSLVAVIGEGCTNDGAFVLVTADPITVGTTDQDWRVREFWTASRTSAEGGGSVQTALDNRLPLFGTLADAKSGNVTNHNSIQIAERAWSTWQRWSAPMEALPAGEEDFNWFTHDDSSKWTLANRVDVTPMMSGCAGFAKTYNFTTGKMEQDPDATDDTDALHAWLQLAARGRKLLLDNWYAVYPTTSGTTIDTNGPDDSYYSRPVPSGYITPRLTYRVLSDSGTGTITYDGTVYNDGDTFVGQAWDQTFATSGDALVYDRVRVGPYLDFRTDLDSTVSNYQREIEIDCAENAGLLLMEAGCALGIFGYFPNDTAATDQSKVFNAKIKLRVEGLLSLGDVATMGVYASDLSHGSEITVYTYAVNQGGILKECWNIGSAYLKWVGYSDPDTGDTYGLCGFNILNMNQWNACHLFSHIGQVAGWLKFMDAHGCSGGETIVVSFDGTTQYTGTVDKVQSTTQIFSDRWTKAESTALDAWTATIDGGSAVNIIDGRSSWSKAAQITNPDGAEIYVDCQNRGGFGLDILQEVDQGGDSVIVHGHIEGPSTGIRCRRSDTLSGTEALKHFSFNGSILAGRAGSASEFGRFHAIDLDYVYGGEVKGWLWSKEYIATAGYATVWAASTAYSLDDVVVRKHGVYRCTTAGTSGTYGPTGTGTGISDGSGALTWDFVRHVNNTLLIAETCENVLQFAGIQETNTIYNQSCNLQTPKTRPVGDCKAFSSNSGTLLINRSGISSADGSALDYRLSDYITNFTDERRQPTMANLEIEMVLTAPTSGSYTGNRYIGLQLSHAGMNTENKVIRRVTATEAREIGAKRMDVLLPLDQYQSFLAQVTVGGTGGTWSMDLQVRIKELWY